MAWDSSIRSAPFMGPTHLFPHHDSVLDLPFLYIYNVSEYSFTSPFVSFHTMYEFIYNDSIVINCKFP